MTLTGAPGETTILLAIFQVLHVGAHYGTFAGTRLHAVVSHAQPQASNTLATASSFLFRSVVALEPVLFRFRGPP